MTPTKFLFYNLVLLLFFLPGCDWVEDPPKEVDGWKPMYGDASQLENIFAGAPESLITPGKIYLLGTTVFINDVARGILVVNNSDPRNPQAVSFIHIPLNVDLAVKGNVLYADNGPDLVAIDITNPLQVNVLKRISSVFDPSNFPPQEGWFECVDPTKGIVLGWEPATLEKPECFR